jgi:pilus assembly protein CpaF
MSSPPRGESPPTNRHAAPHVDAFEKRFQELKASIHQELVESLDLSKLAVANQKVLERHIRQVADQVCRSRGEVFSQIDRERLLEGVIHEMFGLGPLEPLLADPLVTDILVNDAHTVYIERRGQLELTDVMFADDSHLIRIIQRIVGRLGRRIDEVSPMVDARLPDGSRVNAIIPPLALDGPSLSIRRFGVQPLAMDDLIHNGALQPETATFLAAAVEARVGVLVSGGTGAGKTTMLNALSAYIPENERLVTIEDSAELILSHRHRVRLETRPANAENTGEVSQRDLVRNALRMRPDRIIVGEVRGSEVWDMLQAMNTGHEGSLTTVHANSASDALARLEMMVAMSSINLPIQVTRQYIASGIKLVVQLARLRGGPRKVMQIAEIVGIADGEFIVQEIFGFEQTGVDKHKRAVGEFYCSGYTPKILSRIHAAGVELPPDMFAKRRQPERAAGASRHEGNGRHEPSGRQESNGKHIGNGRVNP